MRTADRAEEMGNYMPAGLVPLPPDRRIVELGIALAKSTRIMQQGWIENLGTVCPNPAGRGRAE